MSEVINRVKEKYPEYKDVPDDQLTLKIAEKYPEYLDADPQFKSEYQTTVAAQSLAVGAAMQQNTIRTMLRVLQLGGVAQAAPFTQPDEPKTEKFVTRAGVVERPYDPNRGPLSAITQSIIKLDLKPVSIAEAARQFMAAELRVDPDKLMAKPTEESVAKAMQESKLAATSMGVAKGLEEQANFFTSPLGVATLGMGALPKLAQRAIALGFAAQMGSHVPELATQMGGELGKENPDYQKVGRIATQAALSTGFTVAGVLHGVGVGPKGETVKSDMQEVVDRIKATAPASAEALRIQAETPPQKTVASESEAGTTEVKSQGDFERYQELVKQVKGKSLDEALPLNQEMEDIKSRYKGFPPPKPIAPGDLRPAVQIDGNGPPTAGELGDSHSDIISKAGKDPDSIPHPDPRRGFIDVNNPGILIDRKTAEARSGLKGTADAGGLDSQDLPGGERSQARVGMGAAVPAEFESGNDNPTSIKNAVVDRERASRGLPSAVQPARKSFGEVWDRAMQRLDSNPGEQDRLLDELRKKPRALTDEEDAIILQRQIDLQNEYSKAARDLAQAVDDGRTEDIPREQLRAQWLSDQLLDIYDIGKKAGTETGRGLNARKLLANEDFSLAKMMIDARVARGGRQLSLDESAEVRRLHDELNKKQVAYDEYVKAMDQRLAELESKLEHAKMARGTKGEAPANLEDLKKATVERVKERKDNNQLDSVAIDIQKLARAFVASGITEREALIDAVHEVIKEAIPEFTRRDTMDAISGYGQYKLLRKDEVSIKLRDLKGQMQQLGKLEDMANRMAPKKTGIERRQVTDEERRLIKQVEEAKKKGGFNVTDPATQLRSALQTIKTRLSNQIADLEHQITTREKIVKTKTQVVLDEEANRLKARRDQLKKEFDEIFTRAKTDAERIKSAIAHLEKQSFEFEQRIKSGEFTDKKTSPLPETDELKAARARRDAIREEFEHLRDLDEEYSAQKAEQNLNARKVALEKRIAELEKKVAAKDTSKKPTQVSRPAQPEIEQLIQQREDLNRQLAELRNPKKSPEQLALQAIKTRTANRIAELQDKIARGDYTVKKRGTTPLDSEARALRAELEVVKRKFQDGLALERFKARKPFEKGADWLTRLRRFQILSSPVALAKLVAAAVERLAFTPIEEVIGGGISKVIPQVAEKAAREGGLNTRAEAKALASTITDGMKDAWQVAKTGRSELDVLYGSRGTAPPSILDFWGHLHGMLKASTKRAEFTRSFEKRLENAAAHGVDIHDPLVQMRIGIDAYKDGQASIFMQNNMVTDAYKAALARFVSKDKSTGAPTLRGKAAATALRIALPIIKVPTNIVAETLQYAVGSLTGSVRLGRALAVGMDNLSPEQADMIMRSLKKGSLGLAVMTLGYLNPDVIGGYYQPREKRKKDEPRAGGIMVGGYSIPSFLLHNPLLETLQLGATVRRVSDATIRGKQKGIAEGFYAGAIGVGEQVPFVREMKEAAKAFDVNQKGAFWGELGKSMLIPQLLQWSAQYFDEDAAGNPIQRKPRTAIEHLESGIPGLRENVPIKR